MHLVIRNNEEYQVTVSYYDTVIIGAESLGLLDIPGKQVTRIIDAKSSIEINCRDLAKLIITRIDQ